MQSFVALLRAVNVGGTGKLAMPDLKRLSEGAGLHAVRTYIASGTVVFRSALDAASLTAALEAALHAHAGKPIAVILRTAAEIDAVRAGNPFPDAPGNQVMSVFLDRAATPAMLDAVTGRGDGEELRLGRREIYVWYGQGMGTTKLRIPAARHGTARNMNTVAKLAEMAAT